MSRKLKQLRKEKNWSQDELAFHAQIDGRQVSRYANDRVMPSVDVIVKIAKAYDISIDYLLLEDAPPALSRLTQVQLAEMLGVSQQTITSFEKGRRRVPVYQLPTLAKALALSVEELLGQEKAPRKRGPAPRLLQQMERINQLPKAKQRFVMEMLDTVLLQNTG